MEAMEEIGEEFEALLNANDLEDYMKDHAQFVLSERKTNPPLGNDTFPSWLLEKIEPFVGKEPHDVFAIYMYTSILFHFLVEETNRYAHQKNRIFLTDESTMRSILGILYLNSYNRILSQEMY